MCQILLERHAANVGRMGTKVLCKSLPIRHIWCYGVNAPSIRIVLLVVYFMEFSVQVGLHII